MIKEYPFITSTAPSDHTKAFITHFLAKNDIPKFIFGRNVYTDDLLTKISVDGIIDDFYTESNYQGVRVVKLEQVPKSAYVLVVAGGKIKTAMNRVTAYGVIALDYFSFYKYAPMACKDPVFMEDFEQDFSENSHKYTAVYHQLKDQLSQHQMLNLINFKLSCDIDYLREFEYLEPYQYIESFLDLSDHEVFVDVGGFDGHTSHFFIEKVKSYHHIYFFEPDAKNLILAQEKLSDFDRITYYPLAVSDREDKLYFSSTGSTSKQDEKGDIVVSANSLDNMIHDRVTFIKMDIEGAEESAILGAKRLIRNYTPKLAICVYHKSSDIWKIPELVFSINDQYDIYLRHYTESIYETVMYFVPKISSVDNFS